MSSQFGCGSNPDALRNHWEMFDPLVGHLSLGWSIQSPKSSNQGRQPRHQKVSKAINIFSQQCLKMQFYTNKNAKSRLGGSSMIRFEKKMLPHGTFNHPLPCTISSPCSTPRPLGCDFSRYRALGGNTPAPEPNASTGLGRSCLRRWDDQKWSGDRLMICRR